MLPYGLGTPDCLAAIFRTINRVSSIIICFPWAFLSFCVLGAEISLELTSRISRRGRYDAGDRDETLRSTRDLVSYLHDRKPNLTEAKIRYRTRVHMHEGRKGLAGSQVEWKWGNLGRKCLSAQNSHGLFFFFLLIIEPPIGRAAETVDIPAFDCR